MREKCIPRKSAPRLKHALSLAAALASLASSHRAIASNATWTGATDATWTNPANWSPSGPPGGSASGNTDTATFNSATSSNTTITVDANRNIKNITFDTASVAAYTFNAGNFNGTTNGEFQMTSTVTNSQTFNIPISFNTGNFTFANNASNSSATFNYLATIGSGNLTLAGSNTGNNIIGGPSTTISAALVKTGTGTWTAASAIVSSEILQGTLQYANTAQDVTVDGTGIALLNGPGTMANVSFPEITLSNGGTFTTDNTISPQANRMHNAILSLLQGSFNYIGGNGPSTDSLLEVNFGGGANNITLTPSSTSATTITIADSLSLSTSGSGTLLITGSNLGAAPGPGVTNVIDTANTLNAGVGGSTSAGSTNINIAATAVGRDLAQSGNAQYGFVTGLGTANGVRLLNLATESSPSINEALDFNSAFRNISLTTVANITHNTTTINSLRLDTGASVTGPGTLTLHGTNILALPGNNGITVANLNFTSQAALFTTIGDLNLSSQITSTQFPASPGLVKSGPGTLFLQSSPQSYLGLTVINQGTLQINATNQLPTTTGLVPAGGALDLNGFNQTVGFLESVASGQVKPQPGSTGAVINFNANPMATLTLRSTAATATFNGSIGAPGANNLSFTNDPGRTGITTLSGANSYTGPTTLLSGNLILSYANDGSDPSTNVISPASSLIDGSAITFISGTPGATQTFNGLTVNPGSTVMTMRNVTGSTLVVNFGNITRNIGGTVDFDNLDTAPAGFTTTQANTNGIIGGYATFAETDWAVSNGAGNLITAATYTNDTWAPGNNVTVTASSTQTNATANSLRFAASILSTITLSGACTLTSGGILVTSAVGSNIDKITGGTLEGAANADLIVNDFATSFEIDSTIADNNSATALTESGGGILILTAANSYTGPTFINSGTLQISSNSNLGSPATATSLNLDGGTLRVTASIALDNAGANPRPVVVNGNGGTLFVQTDSTLTVPGVISGSAAGALTLTNGTDIFTNANTFSGVLNVASVLQLGNANAAQNATVNDTGSIAFSPSIGSFTFGALEGSANLVLLDTAQVYVALTVGGNGSNTTYSGTLSGGNSFTKIGTGSLTLTAATNIAGFLTVNAGALTLGTSSNTSDSISTIKVAAGATLNVNANINPFPAPAFTVDGAVNFGKSPGGILSRNFSSLKIDVTGSVAVAPPISQSARTVLNVAIFSNTGFLDLTSNDMIVPGAGSTGYTTIANEIAQGRNGGWGTPWLSSAGITSSTAASTNNTALAIELNDDGHGNALLTTFDNQTVHDGDVLVKYTFTGDADLSGTINATDYTLIDNGFNSAGAKTGWRNGDFNYDGVINGDDYTLIDNAFNTQGSTSFAGIGTPAEMIAANTSQIAQFPEPSISLLALAAVALMEHRTRRSRRRSIHKLL